MAGSCSRLRRAAGRGLGAPPSRRWRPRGGSGSSPGGWKWPTERTKRGKRERTRRPFRSRRFLIWAARGRFLFGGRERRGEWEARPTSTRSAATEKAGERADEGTTAACRLSRGVQAWAFLPVCPTRPPSPAWGEEGEGGRALGVWIARRTRARWVVVGREAGRAAALTPRRGGYASLTPRPGPSGFSRPSNPPVSLVALTNLNIVGAGRD